jgi:hypothetical protein
MLSASSLYHDVMTTSTTVDEQNALDTIQVNISLIFYNDFDIYILE